MRNSIIILSIVLFFASSVKAQNSNSDEEAIKNVIQTAYVEGLQNEGDAKKIDSGFHKDFRLLGVDETGHMWILPIENWKQSALEKREKGKLPRSKENLYRVEFENIDITGNAAIAKLQCYSGEKLTFVDYISLYKLHDGWKIVNKIYYKF